ncbi:MBL fold metallo-hydrolase [Tunicatimonas pelagia]|uniref:MBL fold metallo-hydrolase n=1 Tax=Tunicatimonas pelagia TaxID=931531 RepID=UPI00266686F3|nr:MBL fold metallo-hydrolase [Tunicatimonas pelagia]WKN43962.1 MBL fold metallo-hydrolase [Tunicatimonas pelagia]
MKVTFLGTGTSQGVPVIGCSCEVCTSVDFRDKRLRTSVHIEVNGKSIIIDSGPDFRQQVLANRIRQLDALVFTHEHKDHTAGMDDVRSFNFLQQRSMPVYAHPRVQESLKREFSYVFAEKKYPGVPQIDLHSIGLAPFQAAGVTLQPVEVMHYKLPVLGFRVHDFTYITDAKTIAEEEKEKIRGSKVLVLNALQKQPHISHFTLDEALAMVEELQPKQAYFTHLSHRMGTHRNVEKELPGNVQIAYDGLTITV